MNYHKLKAFLALLFIVIFLGSVYKKEKNEVYANNGDMKVSIIVPVYNVERYISVCMDSLIKQTLSDIEIICIDDGSTDRSGKILDEYAKKDNRIVVIHQENKGVSGARNRGLDYHPRGEYTTFLDSDDCVEEDTYRYMYNVAKVHDSDVVAFGYRRFIGDGKYSLLNKCRGCLKYKNRYKLVTKIEDYRVLSSNCWHCTNKLYKTVLIEKNGIRFMEDVVDGEDLIYNLMLTPYVKKYESVNRIFYNYRGRKGSITAKSKNNDGIKNCIKAIPVVCNQWRKYDILKGNEDYILNVFMYGFWYLIEDTAKNDVSYAKEIAESFGEDVYNATVLTRCSRYTKNCVEKLEEYRRNV